VKQVTRYRCYAKQVILANGQPALVEVGISQVRDKRQLEPGWRDSLLVNLNLAYCGVKGGDCGGGGGGGSGGATYDSNKNVTGLSAEEIVDRWELLRDCWLQLADNVL
jgi:hypothetical protein